MLRRKKIERQTKTAAPKKNEPARAKPYRELKAKSKRDTVRIGIGVDIGTGNINIAIVEEGGESTVIESPMDGTSIPACYFEDPKTGEEYFGSDAMNRAYDAPEHLAMHVKRNLARRPQEKVYCKGKYNAIEVTTKLLDHALELLLNARPDVKEYAAFGGNKHSAEEMVIILTTPADWGIEEHASLKKAAKASGFHNFDGFIAEPTAAARCLAHVPRVHLQNGNKILTFDVGAGTSDFVVNEYNRGRFDQIVRASGDGFLGGHDFTNLIAQAIANEVGVSWKSVFGSGGFSPANANAKDRESIIEIWNKAEKEVKPRLSIMESVDVVLNLPKGRKRCTITRAKTEKLSRPVFAKLDKSVASALDGSELSFTDMDYHLLVGGSAAMHGMASHVAKAVGIDESELIVSKDSPPLIAVGAAEHAFFQQDSSQAVPGGMGFRIRQESGGHLNILFVEPGQIVTSVGFYVEKSGFYIDFKKGNAVLEIEPFCVKSGVRVTLSNTKDTVMQDSEVAYLEPIRVTIEDWPEGEHDIEIGVTVDANRNQVMLIRPQELPDVEVLAVSLDAAGEGTSVATVQEPQNIMLLLDCSRSMKGEKIKALIAGASRYVEQSIEAGHSVGLLTFPGLTTFVNLTRESRELQGVIKSLRAGGGTPTHEALTAAGSKLLPKDKRGIGVLYTDGQPNYPDLTEKAASFFKAYHRLICVGIGKDACTSELIKLASSRGDYIDVTENPADIVGSFEKVAARINARDSEPPQNPSSGVQPPSGPKPPVGGNLSAEKWDDIEGLEGEVA